MQSGRKGEVAGWPRAVYRAWREEKRTSNGGLFVFLEIIVDETENEGRLRKAVSVAITWVFVMSEAREVGEQAGDVAIKYIRSTRRSLEALSHG